MEKKTEPLHPDEWLKDLPVEPQIQHFDAEAMIECEKCSRKSPPTRLKCLYCGANLQVSAEQAAYLKPVLRKMEEWEKGFNVILVPDKSLENSDNLDEISKTVFLEKENLRKIFRAGIPLALGRAETQVEAEVIGKKLLELGVSGKIISDEQLQTDKHPRRLRALEFDGDEIILILFNSDEIVRIKREKLSAIVVGANFERQIEASESVKKKDDRKALAMTETASDEILIDIYVEGDAVGYRVEVKGFDFSCLGEEKAWLAKDNAPKLAAKIRSFAPNAAFNEDYLKFREEIGKVWEVSQKTESGGFNRKGVIGFTRSSVTRVSNLQQFTRYSRLQYVYEKV